LYSYSNTNKSCASCHVHPHATESWKNSYHFSKDTIHANCIDCHLPPEGNNKSGEKLKLGIKDLYAYLFIDSSNYNWQYKSQINQAVKHTFELSCLHCHDDLYPLSLSEKGEKAHFYYQHNNDELHCIHCHIDAGHEQTKTNFDFKTIPSIQHSQVFKKASELKNFTTFTEYIPSTSVQFHMTAIPGGSFTFSEQKLLLKVDSFYIGTIEVSWDEYLSFLSDTSLEQTKQLTDAVSGATPAFGDPSQGWGMGKRPAIMMTPHAAQIYCKWLSRKTNKRYRLPTEAEWEYAHSLDNKKKLQEPNKVFIIHKNNSKFKTQLPSFVEPNSTGIKNMPGNVWEICSDTYSENEFVEFYTNNKSSVPYQNGNESVLKGGAYDSNLKNLNQHTRKSTDNTSWKKTDPQIPKSIWWYTDCINVGFRVVCEPETK
jgi:formylglycine-generating enzyme required for sulfatase activity